MATYTLTVVVEEEQGLPTWMMLASYAVVILEGACYKYLKK